MRQGFTEALVFLFFFLEEYGASPARSGKVLKTIAFPHPAPRAGIKLFGLLSPGLHAPSEPRLARESVFFASLIHLVHERVFGDRFGGCVREVFCWP